MDFKRGNFKRYRFDIKTRVLIDVVTIFSKLHINQIKNMPSLLKVALTTFLLGIDMAVGDYCSTIHSDFTRRQLLEHSVDTPYDETGGAKHVPFIEIENGMATVTVGDGNPFHPMVASEDPSTVHFVSHIYVMDQDGNIVHLENLDPVQGAPAVTSFEIPSGTTSLTAYEWCNLHGLWVGPTVDVATEGTTMPTCSLVHPTEASWPSIHADLVRMQSNPPFSESSPYTETSGAKHTPYITLSEDGTSGSVVVGTEEVYHPMDGEKPHWVTVIYITDENDTIIAMKNLDPNDVDKAEMTFDIPEGVKEVSAWEFCNLHGLWKGPSVSVKAAVTMEETEETESSPAAYTQVSVAIALLGLFATL